VDHGHPLNLGLHVRTPEDAEAAEALGYDLLVVPDDGAVVGPDSLDAWTLLSYVAARTSTAQVATSGLDLDGHPPTVLARAAAGLDHLAGGRLALGLAASAAGAGQEPDDVAATEEAVAVVRGMWDAADPTPLRFSGAHHRVPGAERGPAPAHPVPLWLSGAGEAGRDLAARVADGWWLTVSGSVDRTPAVHRLDDGAPAVHRVDSGVPAVHRVNGGAPAVHRVNGGAPAVHRVNGGAPAVHGGDGGALDAPEAGGALPVHGAESGSLDDLEPTLDDAVPTALREQRRALDAAASAAGRDPREVRMLLSIDPALVRAAGSRAVDLLTRAVVDGGAGTIVLADVDSDDAAWFAAEIAAPLRAAVAAERTTRGTVVGTVRSAAVRAARRPHIDYDGIPAVLRDDAVEPGDPAYAHVRSTYMRGGRPGLVLRPGSTAEVVHALVWARTQDVPLAIRSGGHGISGRSTNDGGVVIDLGRMNAIEVIDTARRRVRVQAGARWGEVAQALHPYGWAITSGDYGGVGVGGLATAGGIGFLAREHGLTLDRVRAVEVVLADGSVVRADEHENADLFWGVRGAGGNLGIVTTFELEADEVGDVGFAQLVFDATDTADFLHRFGALTEAAPRDLTPFLILGRPRGGQVVAQMMAMVDSDDPDTIIDRLQPFASLGPLLQQAVQVVPYPAVVSLPDAAHSGEGEPVTRSAMVEHITPALAEEFARLIRSGETYFFQIRAAGGAVGDVPEGATAYPHRSAQFSVVTFGSSRRRLDAIWDAMAEHFTGIYSSFETDRRPERLPEVFGVSGLARLRDLKRRYDPEDVFRHNHSVSERGERVRLAAGTGDAG
jgi:alkanesulfonate monooxygenase SsuD/methylene tetrahydromethanopterin reductase-like flavin-dependent oxidoreductase (luciferase family)